MNRQVKSGSFFTRSPLIGINGDHRGQCPLVHTPRFDIFQVSIGYLWQYLLDNIWGVHGIRGPWGLMTWLLQVTLFLQPLTPVGVKVLQTSKDCEFLPQTSHIESLWQQPGGNQGNQCRLSGSSTDWPPKRSWWCFGQLIKSLSQMDMNFTTLIMLIFTAILAHRLGIERVKSMLAKTGWNLMILIFWPKLIISTPFLTFFHFKCSQPNLTLTLLIQ